MSGSFSGFCLLMRGERVRNRTQNVRNRTLFCKSENAYYAEYEYFASLAWFL
jgi:hypothetical protein